jgi:hypothetical protein
MNRCPKYFVPGLILLALTLTSGAGTFTEDFANAPASNGWRMFGDPSLFQWDSTNRNLRVTWDSSRTNSYFYLPIGTVLSRADSFALNFDLKFDDYACGTTPGKTDTFEAAIGFLNLGQAINTNFSRGVGFSATYGPKNLVEFDFFPAFSSFQPTIAQTMVATNNSSWLYNHDNLQDLTPGQTFHVAMNYSGATRTLTTTVTNGGTQYGPTQTIAVPTNFDFRCDTFSISSYSDVRSTGSLLAHGTVDNITLALPPPPVTNLTGSFSGTVWLAQFTSRSYWLYTLERTTDFQSWTAISAATPGNGASLTLPDNSPPPGGAAYRIRSDLP